MRTLLLVCAAHRALGSWNGQSLLADSDDTDTDTDTATDTATDTVDQDTEAADETIAQDHADLAEDADDEHELEDADDDSDALLQTAKEDPPQEVGDNPEEIGIEEDATDADKEASDAVDPDDEESDAAPGADSDDVNSFSDGAQAANNLVDDETADDDPRDGVKEASAPTGSLLETPRQLRAQTPDEVSEAGFDHKFAAAERHLHRELEAMNPAKGTHPSKVPHPMHAASLLEDAPELTEHDVGGRPESLLETGASGDDAAAEFEKLVAESQHETWGQLAATAEQTKLGADSLKASVEQARSAVLKSLHGASSSLLPSSFAELSGAHTQAEAAAATNAAIDAFASSEAAELEQLKVPHTTIAAALERAKAGASSFAETGNYHDLEDKLEHLQALQQKHLNELQMH